MEQTTPIEQIEETVETGEELLSWSQKFLNAYGVKIIESLIILTIGIIIAKLFKKLIKKLLRILQKRITTHLREGFFLKQPIFLWYFYPSSPHSQTSEFLLIPLLPYWVHWELQSVFR